MFYELKIIESPNQIIDKENNSFIFPNEDVLTEQLLSLINQGYTVQVCVRYDKQ